MNLEWNVFIVDPNKNKVESYNIFRHYRFSEDISEIMNSYSEFVMNPGKEENAEAALDNLKDRIKNALIYYFWSKYEWEIGITEPFRENVLKRDNCPFKKIDVYSQVMMNFDRFFEYVLVMLSSIPHLTVEKDDK